MELLHGQTFEDAIRQGKHSLSTLLWVVNEILSPLAAAHAAGIVHRDLKPENIIIGGDLSGEKSQVSVKLLDFGIARDTQSASSTGGLALGTPYYMSPEQARTPQDVSTPSDIWAVGVILYRILSGSVPFHGDSVPDVLVNACTEPVPELPVDDTGDLLPLHALVYQCLDKDPSRRPQQGAVLKAQLARAIKRVSPAALDQIRRPKSTKQSLPFLDDALQRPSTGADFTEDPSASPAADATPSVGVPTMLVVPKSYVAPGAKGRGRRGALFPIVFGGLVISSVAGGFFVNRAINEDATGTYTNTPADARPDPITPTASSEPENNESPPQAETSWLKLKTPGIKTPGTPGAPTRLSPTQSTGKQTTQASEPPGPNTPPSGAVRAPQSKVLGARPLRRNRAGRLPNRTGQVVRLLPPHENKNAVAIFADHQQRVSHPRPAPT